MTTEHSAEIGQPTCPSECAQTNHPGMEHEQWLPPEEEDDDTSVTPPAVGDDQ